MTSIVASETKNNMLLGIPNGMSSIVRDGFQDHAAIVTILEQAIIQYTDDPERARDTRSPRPHPNRPRAPGAGPKGATINSATRQHLAPEELAKCGPQGEGADRALMC